MCTRRVTVMAMDVSDHRDYYLLLPPSTDEEFFGLEVEETGHVALPLKSAASTENKLVQRMHAIRATLVKKCPTAPPSGDGRADPDPARMSASDTRRYSSQNHRAKGTF